MAEVELLSHAQLRRMTKEALSAHVAELEGEAVRLSGIFDRAKKAVSKVKEKTGRAIHDYTQNYSGTKSRSELDIAKNRVKNLRGTVEEETYESFEYRRTGFDDYGLMHRYEVKTTADDKEHVKVRIFINDVFVAKKTMKGDEVPTPAATQNAQASDGSASNAIGYA